MANQEYTSHRQLSKDDWTGFLVSAIQTNNPVLANFALDHGADVSAHYYQALKVAVHCCYPDIFNVIFKHASDLKQVALKLAIEQHSFHATAWLLVQGAVLTPEHIRLAESCSDSSIQTLIRSYESK